MKIRITPNIREAKYFDRFWSQVDILDGFATDEDCWLWTGSKETDKYGRSYGRMRVRGKLHLVHRLSYRCYKGEFDPKLLILHSYDSTFCINPSHLFLGIDYDNVQDCINKGRFVYNIYRLQRDSLGRVTSKLKQI